MPLESKPDSQSLSPLCRDGGRFRAPAFYQILFCCLLLIYYAGLALTRRVDGDEGYFLYAARLVQAGKLPYADFFYPQMPLMPYLWGWGLWPLGVSWISGRLFTALLATLTALAFLALARRRIAKPWVAGALFAAYLASDFGLEWAVAVKTYMPTVLMLELAWLAALERPAGGSELEEGQGGGKSGLLWGVSGLLAAGALLVRLTVEPLLPLMLGALIWDAHRAKRPWRGKALCWLTGLALGLTPLLFFWLKDPFAFVYDNWRYHALGVHTSLRERLAGNIPVALDRLFLNPIWLGALGLLAWESLRRRRRLAGEDWFYRLSFAVMFVVSAVPVRSFHQYYTMATPWLLLAAAPAAGEWWASVGAGLLRRRRGVFCALAIVAAALLAVEPYRVLERRWPTWTWHPRTPEAGDEFNNRLGVIRHISRRIDALAPPGSRLFTWWPGYALETRTPLVSGMENHFGLRISYFGQGNLSGRLHVLTLDDVQELIGQRKAGVVVVGTWAGMENGVPREFYDQMALKGGYRLREKIGGANLYTAP